MDTIPDYVMQAAEWKARLVAAVIHRDFDDETLAEMLFAGFNQAHSEGLSDAAAICQGVADVVPHAAKVAGTLAARIRDLDRLNRKAP